MISLASSKKALVVGGLASALAFAMGFPAVSSMIGGLLFFVFVFGGLLFWNRLKRRQKSSAIREGLIAAFMDLEIVLSLQWPFEQALLECYQSDPKNAFWRWLFDEWNPRSGEFFPEVIARLAIQTRDPFLIQALDQLELAYQSTKQSKTGFGLNAYALFLLDRARVDRKARGKKMAMVSVLFVLTGSVIPGLLQSFLLVGSAFLDLAVEPEVIFLSLVVGIPILNLFLLVLAIDQSFSQEGA